jgi:DNA-directed RNA polymerase subunit E'/Rpb7
MSTTSPYINTKLYTLVPLKADQMDNKIYLNLKKNLESKLVGKCYKNYGIVMEVFQISQYNEGVIEAENFSSSAIFEIEFSCRLCSPLIGKDIICEILVLTKLFITAKNGPIIFIVPNKDINDKVFKTDNKYNYLYNKDDKMTQLEKGDHVQIKIIQLAFNNGDAEIIGMGSLINMADSKQIEGYYNDMHKKDDIMVDIDIYKNSSDIELLYD